MRDIVALFGAENVFCQLTTRQKFRNGVAAATIQASLIIQVYLPDHNWVKATKH